MNREPKAISEDVTIIEQKMSALERENFDLKMRLFYKDKESLKDTSTLEDEAERVVGILQTRDDTYDQLRRANEEAYYTISELRAELQIVKASKEGSDSAYESLLHKNQRLSTLQLEENLKRERQAAQAIASHDASLIAKLEEDLEALQATHEADNKLVSECAGRVAELMGIIEEKNSTITKQTTALDAANEHIEVLTDRISRQEIFLIRGEQQDLLPKHNSDNSTKALENGSVSDVPPPPPRRNPSSNSLHSSGLNPHAHSMHPSHNMHPSQNMHPSHSMHPSHNMHPSRRSNSPTRPHSGPSLFHNDLHHPHHDRDHDGVHDEDHEEGVGSSRSLRPAPRLGQPFLSRGSEPTSSSNHFTPSHNHNHIHSYNNHTPNTHNLHHVNRSASNSHSLHQSSHSVQNSNFHHFSLSDLSNTAGSFAATPHFDPPASTTPSSTSLRGGASSSSAAAMSPGGPDHRAHPFDMRGFDEESKPSGYLSDEAKKLINAEIEIDVLKNENISLKQNLADSKAAFRRLEETLASVRSSSEEITLLEAEEIARLEVELERMQDERDKFMASSRSFESQNELLRQQRQRDTPGRSQGGQSGSPYSSPLNDRDRGYDSGNNLRESLHHSGGDRLPHNSRSPSNHFSSSSGSRSGGSKAKDSALFDMYRRREVELLDALEGVVKKCHSLEEELKVATSSRQK